MSNRRRAKPPKADAAVDAPQASTRCPDCASKKALRRWNRRVGKWEITPLHYELCPVRTGVVAPHSIALNATAAARDSGFPGLQYRPDSAGGSGGWVVNA
ncbi:MAG: hypothetical protein ACM3ML_25275 [Micromonosporaceae bacterium]